MPALRWRAAHTVCGFIGQQQDSRLKLFLACAIAFPDRLYEPLTAGCARFDSRALLVHFRLRRFESRHERTPSFDIIERTQTTSQRVD